MNNTYSRPEEECVRYVLLDLAGRRQGLLVSIPARPKSATAKSRTFTWLGMTVTDVARFDHLPL